ncbi:hypothetical protein EYF80_028624 [Liparis tanakae]|uniref:Uncharacterized protein n=1 Tax=Liparis tanakae TaxID=230148 RepID=A0A4Z2H5W3_9TELE|nr:hypothetical protein EYF80_028624 [Liparis tanakae]
MQSEAPDQVDDEDHGLEELFLTFPDDFTPRTMNRYGKRHTFPSPTAYDTQARTNSVGLSQLGLASFPIF